MFNFIDRIKENPISYKQLSINEELVTLFNCPIEEQKANIWSHKSYFIYIIEGKKIWHTGNEQFELAQNQCAFVKKGAHIIEQFFDTKFCVVLFFVSDEFIVDTIKDIIPEEQYTSTSKTVASDSPIIRIATNDLLHSFFNSIIPYFLNEQLSSNTLLELKFKELILNVVTSPKNFAIREYFNSLITDNTQAIFLQVMENNFLHNLEIKDYARMCNKSLSTFKRDFLKYFNTTPGKWILKRRIKHSLVLLKNSNKTVSEIAYECGFENTSHFSKAFKKYYNNSPSSYRSSLN